MITANTQLLHRAVTRCMMAQSKIRTPVSGFCKISKPTGDIVLQSFTERLNIETRVRAEGDMEPVLVNMSQLGGLLAVETSPECKLSFGNALLKVQVGASLAHLNTMPVSEFPNLRPVTLATKIGDAKSIAQGITRTAWICTDQSGVAWTEDVRLEVGVAVATNRTCVAQASCDCMEELSINGDNARLLALVAAECDEPAMYLDIASGWVTACSSDWSVSAKLSEAQFPPWKTVVSKRPEKSVRIQTAWLQSIIAASNSIGGAGSGNDLFQVQLQMAGGWMGVTVPGSGGNVWKCEYEVEGVIEKAEATFNLKFLRGALRFLGESCEFFPGETMSFFRNGDFQLAVGHMAKA